MKMNPVGYGGGEARTRRKPNSGAGTGYRTGDQPRAESNVGTRLDRAQLQGSSTPVNCLVTLALEERESLSKSGSVVDAPKTRH